MIGEKFEARTTIAVLRVKAGQRFRVVGRRPEPLGYVVHWFVGAGDRGLGVSLMCPGDDCPACRGGMGGRWVGTLPVGVVLADDSLKIGLMELTGLAWSAACGLLRIAGFADALGVTFTVTRARSRGGLVVEPEEETSQRSVVAVPDWVLLDGMATLYGLPRCVEGMSGEEWTALARERATALVVRWLKLDGG